jgi:microcompartment protein CcmK/EutM
MQLARVIGDVVATMKDAQLTSHKLLVLLPVHPGEDAAPAGRTLVAVDAVGAGVGERVFFVRGKEASFPFLPAETPVDACVVGIVDRCDIEDVPGANARPPVARGRKPA